MKWTARGQWLVALGIVLCCPVLALGQLVVLSTTEPQGVSTPQVTHHSLVDLATGRSTPAVEGAINHSVFLAGAEWALLVRSDRGIELWSTRFGFAGRVLTTFRPSVAHPRDLAVYGIDGSTPSAVVRLTPTGTDTWDACGTDRLTGIDVADDGTLIRVLCQTGTLVVLDARTGTLQRRVTLSGPGQYSALRSNSSGTVVAVIREDPGVSGRVVNAFDATTGRLVAERRPQSTPPGLSAFSRSFFLFERSATGDVVVLGDSLAAQDALGRVTTSVRTEIVDINSLATRSALQTPLPVIRVGLSPDGQTALAVGVAHDGSRRHQVLDVPTGIEVAAATDPRLYFAGAAFPPLAPALTADVQGALVSLTWGVPAHSPAPTRYSLEVGTASGRSDLAVIDLGLAPSLSIPGVPPRHYFVRVRAVNGAGVGEASPETVVKVLP